MEFAQFMHFGVNTFRLCDCLCDFMLTISALSP